MCHAPQNHSRLPNLHRQHIQPSQNQKNRRQHKQRDRSPSGEQVGQGIVLAAAKQQHAAAGQNDSKGQENRNQSFSDEQRIVALARFVPGAVAAPLPNPEEISDASPPENIWAISSAASPDSADSRPAADGVVGRNRGGGADDAFGFIAVASGPGGRNNFRSATGNTPTSPGQMPGNFGC